MRKSPNIGFFLISHFSFPYSFPVCFCVVIVWCLISLMNSSRIYLRDYPLLISRFPTHFPVASFEVQCYGVRFGDKLYGGLGAGFYGMVLYCIVWYGIVLYCILCYGMVWRPVDNPPHNIAHKIAHIHRTQHRSQNRT